ncbi:MAG: 4'-phosphopantetheinyl transferase superfamily protein [Eubacteriales bacterium]
MFLFGDESIPSLDLLTSAIATVHHAPLPPINKTPTGKPYFPTHPHWHFNLSHSKEFVVCALGETPLGVDIQCCRVGSPSLIKRVCSAEEVAWLATQPNQGLGFACLWTLKESFVKYRGDGVGNGIKLATLPTPLPSTLSPFQTLESEGLFYHLWTHPRFALALCTHEIIPPTLEWLSPLHS